MTCLEARGYQVAGRDPKSLELWPDTLGAHYSMRVLLATLGRPRDCAEPWEKCHLLDLSLRGLGSRGGSGKGAVHLGGGGRAQGAFGG